MDTGSGMTKLSKAATAGLACGLLIAGVVFFVATSGGHEPASMPEPAEAVAASPVDAGAVAQQLGRRASEPISAGDPLVAQDEQELTTDGVDQTRGVPIFLADGATEGWLLSGNGTVCLVLPGVRAGVVTTNCEEAGNARQHGVGRITTAEDPSSPSASYSVDLVMPPGTMVPFVSARGTDHQIRAADVSADGSIASLRVSASEDVVNPAAAGGHQRLFTPAGPSQ